MRFISRCVFAFVLSLVAGSGQADGQPAICKDFARLDWSDKAKWAPAAAAERPRQVQIDDDDPTPDAMQDDLLQTLGKLSAPKALGPELKQALLVVDDIEFTSYSYYNVEQANLVYFGMTQGSGNCHYDVWAQERDGLLSPIDAVPFSDQGDVCDTDLYFGAYERTPLIIRFQYVRPTPLDGGAPKYVEIAVADTLKWNDACRFDLKP